jgi:hypothetical protein
MHGKREIGTPDRITTMVTLGAVAHHAEKTIPKLHVQWNCPEKRLRINADYPINEVLIKRLREQGTVPLVKDQHGAQTKSIAFKLEDKIEGIDFIFGVMEENNKYLKVGEEYHWGNYCNQFSLYAIPASNTLQIAPKSRDIAFAVGVLDIDNLRPIAERRFTYIFGTSPADWSDITTALIMINHLPTIAEDGEHKLHYDLKEAALDSLRPTRGVSMLYEEAKEAQSKGLFTDIKAYELVGTKVPKNKDPVLVGFDHFGQKYPIIYWTGDKAPEK